MDNGNDIWVRSEHWEEICKESPRVWQRRRVNEANRGICEGREVFLIDLIAKRRYLSGDAFYGTTQMKPS